MLRSDPIKLLQNKQFKKWSLSLFFLIIFCVINHAVTCFAAGRAIKTVEYFIGQQIADVRTAGISYASPQFWIYIPETGFTFRSAFIEVHTQVGGAVAATVLAGSEIGVNGANTQTYGQLVTNSGEELDYYLRYNANAAFSGLAGNGTNNGPYYVGVKIMTGARENESVKLYLTYEYDDTSPTQLNTVRLLAGTRNTALTAATTATFAHTPYIPESGYTIRSLWYEIRTHSVTLATDIYANIKLNAGSLQYPKLEERALNASGSVLYLYQPGTNPNIGVTNNLTYNAIGLAVQCLSAELVITYSYNYSASETLSRTVRRYLGQTDVITAAAEVATYYTQNVYFPEAPVSPTIRSIYTKIHTSHSANINLSVSGAKADTLAYAVAGTLIIGPRTILHNLLSAYGNISNDSSVTVAAGWSALGGGSRSAELVYTYEYPKAVAHYQKTAFYGAEIPQPSGGNIQDTVAVAGLMACRTYVYMPEDNQEAIACVVASAKSTKGSTLDSKFKVYAGGADTAFRLDGDGEALLAERIADLTSQITGPGQWTINVNVTTTADVNEAHLANAVSYATYYGYYKSTITVTDIAPPNINEGKAGALLKINIKNNNLSAGSSIEFQRLKVRWTKNGGSTALTTANAQGLFNRIMIVADSTTTIVTGTYQPAFDTGPLIVANVLSASIVVDANGENTITMTDPNISYCVIPPQETRTYFLVVELQPTAASYETKTFDVEVDADATTANRGKVWTRDQRTDYTVFCNSTNSIISTTVTANTSTTPSASQNDNGQMGPVYSTPTYNDTGTTAYVGSNNNKLYCLNAVTGAIKWSYSSSGKITSSPTVICGSETIVYFGNENGVVYALRDNGSGYTEKWTRSLPSAVRSSPTVITSGSDSYVFVGCDDQRVYKLKCSDGLDAPGWGFNVTGLISSTPSVNWLTGRCYVGSEGGRVYSLLNSDGTVHSFFDAVGAAVYGSPFLYVYGASDTVFIGATNGVVYARSPSNLSTTPTGWADYTAGGAIYGSMFINEEGSNHYLYFGADDGKFYKINAATGAEVWKYPSGTKTIGKIRSSPVVYNNFIYFGSDDGNVYCLDVNGNRKAGWPIGLGAEIRSSPAIDSTTNRLVIGSGEGKVYFFPL